MSTPNFKDTLNQMSKLDDLTQYIHTSNNALEEKRAKVIVLVQHMQKQIETVRTQLDSIKNQGSTASMEIKQLIAAADSKQKDSLKNIKASINSMINLEKLQTAVNNLGNDITSLTNSTNGNNPPGNLNPNAPTFDPTKPPGPNNAPTSGGGCNRQHGGYTYGKSHRKDRKKKRKGRKNSKKKRHY
jgi:hypothetical protein